MFYECSVLKQDNNDRYDNKFGSSAGICSSWLQKHSKTIKPITGLAVFQVIFH